MKGRNTFIRREHRSPAGNSTQPAENLARRKHRGQAAVLLAFSIVALIAVVGLAVDGGSMYAQRRNAQNSSDAVAIGAARDMLNIFNANNGADGSFDDEQTISNTLASLASAHGIARSDVHAYFVNDNKQVVGSAEVGYNGGIAFSQGVKGIAVKDYSQTNAFFMKLMGWNTVGASADSTAFVGVAADSGSGFPVMPVGFFTDTQSINSLQFGQEYPLISSDITSTIGSGNWGYLDFNGNGSSNVDRAWLDCGFDPAISTVSQWAEWCPADRNVGQAIGPTQHFTCADLPNCTAPSSTATFVPYLKWGDKSDGWWLAGQTGTTMSNCHDLETLVGGIDGKEFLVPLFDYWITGNGNASRFHLARIAKFEITDAQVDCHPNHGEDAHWHINGIYESFFTGGSSGNHGDIWHTSAQTVFLDN